MARRGLIRRLLTAATGLVWPRLCEVCGRRLTASEQVMCLDCELSLPATGLHLEADWNEIHQRMAPRPPIERAAALFYYLHDDPYRLLIHNAKYNGRPEILRYLGHRYGLTLRDAGFLDGIDIIEPVPMHWLKELFRGYNQTDWLACGLSQASGIPVGDHLTVKRFHKSQTRKSQLQRWENAGKSYGVTNGDELSGKHILLVDDVITTGATIMSCAKILVASTPNVRVSVAGIGLTHLL